MNETGSPLSRLAVSLGRLLVALLLLGILAPGASAQVIEIKLADETDTGLRDVLLQAILEDAGGQPIELRILRMTLQPGAKSPWHAHPGLEFGVVESGTLRIQVSGQAVVRPADAAPDAESQAVPERLDLSLSAGDRIAYAPGTEMTFENAAGEPAVLLAATVFPTGESAPPSASFRDGPPSAEENQGIGSVILGQAIVEAAPPGSVVVFERLEVDAGGNVAAFPGPVLMALEEGTVAGSVRAPGAGTPGDSTSASTDEVQFNLNRGEAAFFSSGMSEAPLGGAGRIVLLRLGIVPASQPASQPDTQAAGADPTAAPTQGTSRPIPISTVSPTAAPTPVSTVAATPGRTIRTITTRATATPEVADAPPAETPVAAEPTATDDEGAVLDVYPAPGTVMVVNDDDVRIRAEPSLNGAILAGLSSGQLVVVLGEPVDADGYIWYPVQDVAAPDLQGWVAAPFLNISATP